MVQSKGTRFDSHLFKIDFTGKRKYSGRSSDLRRVGAAGEIEARRAMPTSGAAPSGARPGTTSVAASFAATTASFWKSRELQSAWPQEAGAGGGQSAPLLNGTMSETISEKGLPGPESGASSSVRVFGARGTFSPLGMLNGAGELLQIRRKEVNSMKIAIPFLSTDRLKLWCEQDD